MDIIIPTSEFLMQRLLKAREEIHDILKPGIYLQPIESYLRRIQSSSKSLIWLLVNRGKDVGYLILELNGQEHLFPELFISPKVSEEDWKHILNKLRSSVLSSQTLVFFWYSSEGMRKQIRWMEEIGGKVTLTEHVNQIILDRQIRDKLKKIHIENEYQTSILYSDELYQKYLSEPSFVEEMADFKNQAHSSVPLGDSTLPPKTYTADRLISRARKRMQNGSDPFLMIILMDGKTIVGTSKVTLYENSGHNGMTAVRKEYRGRGIGRYLKAKLILKVMENHPSIKHITTENSVLNFPILNVNQSLGFRPILDKIWIELRGNLQLYA